MRLIEFFSKPLNNSARFKGPKRVSLRKETHELQHELHKLKFKHNLELHELRHRQHQEFHKLHHSNHPHHEEFRNLHRSLKFFRPIGIIINLIILYLLFHWVGTKAIGIIFALLLVVKDIFQFSFFRRLEKRVFKPIEQLKQGFTEIARGNYNVTIDSKLENQFGQLILSFNDMAYKLQESERINSEYEENRKTLVGNISHDLKTPITSIQGYLEMILEGNVTDPEKINRYLKTIYTNTAYMNQLIDDLFLFSKLDMEKLDFNYEIMNIQAYMIDMSEEFKFELEERGACLFFQDKTDKQHFVNIDGKRLYQAIRNIIGNAIKYGPEKGLEVYLLLYLQNEHVFIDIKDNGPGINQDKLPYIFDRFYRIDSERPKDLISTGLGLAIAKELVEAQGGKISVCSSNITGTCFTIRLPIEQIL